MDPSWPMRICPQTSELAHVANTRSKDGFKINFHTLKNISGSQQNHRGNSSHPSRFLSHPGVPGSDLWVWMSVKRTHLVET